ncbi:MAG: glycogen/starch synthase [Bacteroidaceae bacterium]|nr:glycogen/starch synthase [Bacteroidaceae bacterium]
MTNSKKVLFVTQEITPYVPESEMSVVGRKLPQAIQEAGNEIRTFMPCWGIINARRNQLHEVIRLSGMNIVIDDTDHPLIIKVASIQAARMQVYFIDNDDLFHKRQMITDADGVECADNVERSVFYARGVLETVKKLRWIPDVIHCQGWMGCVAPMFIKKAFVDDVPFVNTKVVFDAYSETLTLPPPANLKECLLLRSVDEAYLDSLNLDFTHPNIMNRLAVCFSDAVVVNNPETHADTIAFAQERGIPVTVRTESDDLGEVYDAVYNQVLS